MSAQPTKFFESTGQLLTIPEKTTPVYTVTLRDELGNAIGSGEVNELTLTLINLVDEAIINLRDNQDVLNANNVTLSVAGVLTYTLQPADTAIQDQTKAIETHRAVFYVRYNTTKHWRWQVDFPIQNLCKVT